MGDFGPWADVCPFCGETYPLEELNAHANTHFQSAPSSPVPETTHGEEEVAANSSIMEIDAQQETNTNDSMLEVAFQEPQTSISNSRKNRPQERLERLPADPLTLAAVQTMDTQFEPQLDSLMLLQEAYGAAKESDKANSILCRAGRAMILDMQSNLFPVGPLQHFCATSEDRGWGCGYKNCQMLVSHLLRRGQPFEQSLFCGAGYVPDIVSLQAWLECAWSQGFDPEGKHTLEGSVQGSTKWVGAVDIAALLRQFGIQATVVDFIGKNSMHHPSYRGGTVHRGITCDFCRARPIIGLRYTSQHNHQFDLCEHCILSSEAALYGPFTTHGRKETHHESECICCGISPIEGVRYQQKGKWRNRLCQPCYVSKSEIERSFYKPFLKSRVNGVQSTGHEQMIQWIWNYFTEGVEIGGEDAGQVAGLGNEMGLVGNSRQFINTNKAPLYLQHAGHSRTVVGIERVATTGRNGAINYSLIIFDPGTWSSSIQRSLERGIGWQRLLKRGLHTLGHPEYQILYIKNELWSAEAMNSLKSISIAECIYA